MPNMEYCRFHNTNESLQDCLDAMEEMESIEELSADLERSAIQSLRKLCEEFIEKYDEIMKIFRNSW